MSKATERNKSVALIKMAGWNRCNQTLDTLYKVCYSCRQLRSLHRQPQGDLKVRYNLSSNQSDRIRFNEMLERAAEATLNAVKDEIPNIKKVANEYISDMWEMESEFIDTDDIEEAKAIFFHVYREAINNA